MMNQMLRQAGLVELSDEGMREVTGGVVGQETLLFNAKSTGFFSTSSTGIDGPDQLRIRTAEVVLS